MRILLTTFICMLIAIFITQRTITRNAFLPGNEVNDASSAFKRTLDVSEVYHFYKSKAALVIDTRLKSDYERERIPSAIPIALFHGATTERIVVFYGYSEDTQYAKSLADKWDPEKGRIYVLEGGFKRWKSLDLPTTDQQLN